VSGYTPAKKPAARAQRKTNPSKVIAQGMANLGAAKLANVRPRRATAKSGIAPVAAQASADPADLADSAVPEVPVPGGESPSTNPYVMKEHLRRDIGSRVLVLDLTAPDAPRGAPAPSRDAEGHKLQYVAECATHHERKYFGAYATACRAAKASHQWCPGCKRALARHHRLHSKASAQSSPRR
jgi:hypothetical protein